MKSIENNKIKYLESFARKFYSKRVEDLSQREYSTLLPMAEMWALQVTVIPDNYAQYSLFDFVGYCQSYDGTISLDPISVKNAKDLVSKYCYGITWSQIKEEKEKNPDKIRNFLDKKSQMLNRHKNGNSVVIYGDENVKGKTMLASIIMREAISLRVIKSVQDHSYDWSNFNSLLSDLKREDTEAADCRSCDWLVIDNLTAKAVSHQQSSYLRGYLDPFFTERYYQSLPVILVFRYDVYNNMDITEEIYGNSMVRLLTSKKICRICLREKK